MRRVVLSVLVAVLLVLGDAGQTNRADPPGVGSAHAADARSDQQPTRARRAFPGAQGYGAWTPGGRRGRVIIVRNLKDAGPGSLRAALRARGRRLVVFRVSGTIMLRSDIDIVRPYVTVVGQTARGGGITLRSHPCNGKGVLGVLTHDVVIRYLRFRPGPHPCFGEGESSDGIVVYEKGTYNVVIDHSSISWAVDENVSLWDDAHGVTFSWNIISEGLSRASHAKGEHSKGAHLSGARTYDISFHHNLLAHNNDRNPQASNPGVADIRNNVVYNYGEHAALTSDSHGHPRFNFVANYYRPGRNTDRSQFELDIFERSSAGWTFYVRGNIGPHRTSGRQRQASTVDPAARRFMRWHPFRAPRVRTTTARRAFHQVLADAGARVPHRDAVDRRIVGSVRHRTGRIISHPSQVGGWPRLPARAPRPDRDRDGMPNRWERAHGLNPRVKSGAADRDRDGWTNIEEFVNGLVR